MSTVDGLEYTTARGTVIQLFPAEPGLWLLTLVPCDEDGPINLQVSDEFIFALSGMHHALVREIGRTE